MTKLWSVCMFLALISMVNTQQIGGVSCQMPIDPGTCGALYLLSLSNSVQRYAYDSVSRRCVQFTYSGCGGNGNRFASYSQCVTACYPTEVSLNEFLILIQRVLTGQI